MEHTESRTVLAEGDWDNMKCPICDKEYDNYGWFARHMIKNHEWDEAESLDYWKYHCPFCGAPLADSCKMCWRCKAILDPALLRLSQEIEKNE